MISGEQITGRYVRLFAERHLRDLERSLTDESYPYYFDPKAGQHCIDFFSFLKPSKWDAIIELLPWQQALTMVAFGWKRKSDGKRRYRVIWIELARKQGKSALGSGWGLYLTAADGEGGAEVYSAALTRDQARRVFDEAVAMRDASPDLRELIGKAGKKPCNNLHVLCTASMFKPLSRDEDLMEGLNVHGAIMDEIHKWKERDTWDVIRYGMRSRKQPMAIFLTTAGSAANHESLCFTQHDYGVKVLEGVYEDDAFLPFIANLDSEDVKDDVDPATGQPHWMNEKNWIKACPSLDVLVTADAMRQEALEARNSPAALNAFKRYSLNMWLDSADAAIEIAEWDACKQAQMPDLTGKSCYAGLDLAMTYDMSSLVLYFDDGSVLPFYWIPENNIQERCDRDHVPYDRWQDGKHLITTPGHTTDYDFIRDKILELSKQYDIREVAYDPSLATPLVNSLMAAGYPQEKLVKFSQTAMMYAAPCNDWMRRVFRRELKHYGHPILRWNVTNLVWRYNSTGLIQPDKEKAPERIDGAVAMIMALGRAFATDNAAPAKPKFRIYVPA